MATLGETLQQAREQMGVSLDEAERETRIRSKILAAFEDDNQAELPAPVYARGLLRNYANYLGIEPDTASEMYDAQANAGKGRRATQPVMNLAPAVGEVRTTLRYPPGILAVFIVLVLAIFLVIVGSNMLGLGRKNEVQSNAIPTPRPSTPTAQLALSTSTAGVVAFLPTPTSAGAGSQASTSPIAATGTPASRITATPAPPNPNVGIGTPVVGGGIAASPTPTPPATQVRVTLSPTFAPTGPGNGVQITMIAVADSWARVTVDGLQQFDGTMASGSRRTFSGDSTIYVWVGNGGGIQVVVNGQNRGTLGAAGQVVKRQWDANGNETAGLYPLKDKQKVG